MSNYFFYSNLLLFFWFVSAFKKCKQTLKKCAIYIVFTNIIMSVTRFQSDLPEWSAVWVKCNNIVVVQLISG